jgi:ABC-type phosphate transport system substrate-binding protein
LRIPREVLADIFLGRIRQWSALAPWNPPLAGVDRNITLIVRSESSGTTDAFTGALSSFSPAWKALVGRSSLPEWPQPEGMNVIKAEGNAGVALQLKLNRYSIGYLSQVDAELYGVTSASIQNKAGEFIAPSLQAVQSAMDTFETELSVLGGSGSKSFFLSIADPPDTSAKSYPIAMLSYFVFDVAKLACDQLRDILFLIYWCVMLQRCAACCIRPAFGLLHLACCTLRAGHGRTPRRRRLRPAGASPLSVRKLQRSSSRRCGGLNV